MARVTVASGLLFVINVVFLTAGILLIKFAHDLQNSGWVEALKDTDYKSSADTLVLVVQLLGYASCGVALLGLVAAVTRHRLLLVIYAVLMIVAMIVFGIIGGTAFSFKGQMQSWQNKAFPAEQSEQDFAVKFNEAYCYAQGAYFCNNATTSEIVAGFIPNVSTETTALLPKVQGINALCSSVSSVATSVSGMDSVCKACKDAQKYVKFEKVLTWTNKKCPRTSATSTWCAQFLQSGKDGEVYVNSPYKECRGRFLDIVVSWANSLAITGSVAAVMAALLLALACFSRRDKPTTEESEFSKA